MKKVSILSALMSLSAFGQTTNPSPYCSAQYSDDFMLVPHAITNVQLASLQNTSGSVQAAAPHYVFYSNLTAPNLTKGQSYTIAITHDDGTTIHGLAAWIDFNGDHDFDDAGEKLGETLWPGNDQPDAGDTRSYTFTVPSTALVGTTRLRVRLYEDDDYTFSGNNLPVLPCQFNGVDADWGETEDYTVGILSGSTATLQELLASNYLKMSENQVLITSELVASMSIIGMNGQLALSSTTVLNTAGLAEGVYMLELQFKDGTRLATKLVR